MSDESYPKRETRVGDLDPGEWQPCRIADVNLLIPATDVKARRTVADLVPAKPGRNAVGYYMLDDTVRLVYRLDRNLDPVSEVTNPEQPVLFLATRDGAVAGVVVDDVNDAANGGSWQQHSMPAAMAEGSALVDSVSVDPQGEFHFLTTGDAIVGHLKAHFARNSA